MKNQMIYTIEKSIALDLKQLRKSGAFKSTGSVGKFNYQYSSGEVLLEFNWQIALYPGGGRMSVDSNFPLVDGTARSYSDIIALKQSECRFGGSRYWFICNGCKQQARILYISPMHYSFGCRKCCNLRYESQCMRMDSHIVSLIDGMEKLEKMECRLATLRSLKRRQLLKKRMDKLYTKLNQVFGYSGTKRLVEV